VHLFLSCQRQTLGLLLRVMKEDDVLPDLEGRIIRSSCVWRDYLEALW
jgi:hypothetical protein